MGGDLDCFSTEEYVNLDRIEKNGEALTVEEILELIQISCILSTKLKLNPLSNSHIYELN